LTVSEWFDAKGVLAAVKVGDRGFQYGDGLFETIAIRGGQPRLWDYHMDRLARGCKRLAIRMPARDELGDGLRNALQLSGAADHGLAKLVLTAGGGQRGYGRAYADSPFVCYGVFAATLPPGGSYRDGVVTTICETRLAANPPTAGLKTLGRLEQVLAGSELAGTEAYEGLTMDVDGNIICGTMSNLFVVHHGELSTPSLARCGVEGVMRRHIMVTLAEQGIRAEIRTLTLAEMNDSDELFICNSQVGVLPVRRCGERRWPVGEITKTVMATLAASGIAECRL
jgi:4-amino-4-deoxychorismate lyase